MWLEWLTKIRFVMGKITDFLIAGRNAGAWDKKPGGFEGDDKVTKDNFPR